MSTPLNRLNALTEEQRNHAYVQFNGWHWPDAVSDLKPEGFDLLTHKEIYRLPAWEKLRADIHAVTSEFGRSSQWWKEQGIGTPEEHLAWWNNGKKRPAEKEAS